MNGDHFFVSKKSIFARGNEYIRRASSVLLTLIATSAFAADPVPHAPVAVNPLNLLLGLIFLFVIVVAGAWLVRRAGGLPMNSGSGMRIIATLPVGTRERVVLIEIAGEQMLLGVAPGRVNLLHRYEQPVMAANESDFSSKFRQILQQGLGK